MTHLLLICVGVVELAVVLTRAGGFDEQSRTGSLRPANGLSGQQHRGRGGEDRKWRPGVRRAEVLDLPLLRGER
jgi:hypothetical protein